MLDTPDKFYFIIRNKNSIRWTLSKWIINFRQLSFTTRWCSAEILGSTNLICSRKVISVLLKIDVSRISRAVLIRHLPTKKFYFNAGGDQWLWKCCLWQWLFTNTPESRDCITQEKVTIQTGFYKKNWSMTPTKAERRETTQKKEKKGQNWNDNKQLQPQKTRRPMKVRACECGIETETRRGKADLQFGHVAWMIRVTAQNARHSPTCMSSVNI